MKKPKKALPVWVDVSDEEKRNSARFFSLRGMKSAFLDEYKTHTRKELDGFLNNGIVKMPLLKDVRTFIDDHKDEVAEFLHSENAA